jgi:hypothetical protein
LQSTLISQNGSHSPPKNDACADLDKNAYASYCYSKNLKIIFHPDFKEDESDIVGIILFIYKSMLDICDEKKIKKLKLYIDNLLIHSIFMVIATHQADNQDIMKVENYSKWIEIHMH